jgi:hypothetical protein
VATHQQDDRKDQSQNGNGSELDHVSELATRLLLQAVLYRPTRLLPQAVLYRPTYLLPRAVPHRGLWRIVVIAAVAAVIVVSVCVLRFAFLIANMQDTTVGIFINAIEPTAMQRVV